MERAYTEQDAENNLQRKLKILKDKFPACAERSAEFETFMRSGEATDEFMKWLASKPDILDFLDELDDS